MSLPGGKDVKPFLESPTTKTSTDVSPDGRWLMYREYNSGTRGDLKYVALDGDRTARTYIATADDETHAKFSPDGRWVAYVSDDSGRKEVYVAAFPDPARRFRVSTGGGMQPRWSRDGKELFYIQADQLMASSVAHKGDDLAFSQAQPLFKLFFYTPHESGVRPHRSVRRHARRQVRRVRAILQGGHSAARRRAELAAGLKKP